MAQGLAGRMVEDNPDFITANERYFLYFLLSAGFLFIIWMKREAISDTRHKVKELGAKLKAMDMPIEQDNWRDVVPPGSYY